MNEPIGVVIQGGSGFGAGELLRYFSQHPAASVLNVVSSSQAGEPVSKAHPHLAGIYERLTFSDRIDWKAFSAHKRRVAFLALPHGHSAPAVRDILEKAPADTVIIDLSADFRLHEEEAHSSAYKEVPFEAELRRKFVFGLPELRKGEIAGARWIANPGCLSSACILAAYPLTCSLSKDIVGSICFDAKTGTSGAGRTPQESMHHPHRHGNFEAYKVLSHRHEPEIREALKLPVRGGLGTMFVPHLLPTSRGIFVTMYAQLQRPLGKAGVEAAYRQNYAKSPFIRFREGTPRLHDVVGTNFCDLSIAVRDTQLVVMTALDNLGKGMAGQAIQNMNIVFGLPEDSGLRTPALGIS